VQKAEDGSFLGTWKEDKKGRYYELTNGKRLTGYGYKIDGVFYVFRKNGYLMQTETEKIAQGTKNYYHVAAKTGRAVSGWFIYKENLYYSYETGRCAANTTIRGISFGADGKALASANRSLKMKTMQIISSICNESDANYTKLRKAYNYVVYHTWYGGYDPNIWSDGWTRSLALNVLTTHVGNCYGFSAAFAALAWEIGYSPQLVCGRVPGTRDGAADGYTRHCWVRIDGLLYDPELAYAGLTYVYGQYYHSWPTQVQRVVSF